LIEDVINVLSMKHNVFDLKFQIVQRSYKNQSVNAI